MPQKPEEFTAKYVAFAKAVQDLEKKIRAEKKQPQSLLFMRQLPSPEELSANEELARLAQELFSFNLPGLNSMYDSTPWESAISQGLIGPLTFENDRATFLKRLLYPLQSAGYGENFDVTEDRMKGDLHQYATCWNAEQWPYDVVIPLFNFKSDVDQVAVGQFILQKRETIIKSLEYKVQERALQGAYVFLTRKSQIFGAGNDSNWRDFLKELTEAITALRLVLPDQHEFLTDGLGLSDVYLFELLPRSGSNYRYAPDEIMRIPEQNTHRGEWKYSTLPTLTAEHVETLNRYFLDKVQYLSELEFAIRRFNLAYSRASHEDQLIDLVICLESALLPDNDKEINYRLALRMAALLLKDTPPAKPFEIVKMAYETRSQVVHRGMPLVECLTRIETKLSAFGVKGYNFTRDLRELTRLALVELTNRIHNAAAQSPEKKKFVKDICTALDAEVIGFMDAAR